MDVFELPVFPPADVFPMMADEELDELAADIKKHGLRENLVISEIDEDIMLVDGRNRREACRRVGVEPATVSLNGIDTTAYVLSANIHRRHMTKGQRAMAVAKIYPNSPRGRGQKDPARKHEDSSSFVRLVQTARMVATHAPDLVDAVLAGSPSLDEAYAKAKAAKDDAEGETARLANLRERYPELADKVVDGELTLADAVADADECDRLAELSEDKQRRVASGNLTLDEAETLAKEEKREYDESIQRAVDAVEDFLRGWTTATKLRGVAIRDDVLKRLPDHDRNRFLHIEKETTWPATTI